VKTLLNPSAPNSSNSLDLFLESPHVCVGMGEFPENGPNPSNPSERRTETDLRTPIASSGDPEPSPQQHHERQRTAAFLRDCASLGVTMAPDGDTLRVSAPPRALTAELRAQIAERKPAIMAFGVTVPCIGCGRDYGFYEARACFWCTARADVCAGGAPCPTR
jgi:hypothetical protein